MLIVNEIEHLLSTLEPSFSLSYQPMGLSQTQVGVKGTGDHQVYSN